MGQQGDQLALIEEHTRIGATSVAIGGDLYTKLEELVTSITDIQEGKGAKGGNDIKQAIALAIVAPAIGKVGMGLQYVVDAVNSLQGSGKEIKEKTEALVGGLTMLGEVGLSILKFAGYMVLATPLLLIAAAVSPILALTLFMVTGAVHLATKHLKKETLEKIDNLHMVGLGILALMGALAITSLLVPFALKGMLVTAIILPIMMTVLAIAGKLGGDSAQKTTDMLLMAAAGILALMVSLTLTSFLAPFAMKGLLPAMLIVAGIGLVFGIIGVLGDKIEDGAKGLLFAAGAILGIGIALALFNLISPPLPVLLNIAMAVGAVALMFYFVGLAEKQINKGAKALLWAALSIVVIGIAIKWFSMIVGNITGEEALKGLAAIAVIGLIVGGMYLAGKGAKHIIKGAVALIITGVSLILLGVGLKMITKSLGATPWASIAQTLALVTGLGLVMAAAGLGAAFILPGAAAMLVVGGALILIGVGMMALGKAYGQAGVQSLIKEKNGELGIVTMFKAISKSFIMWPWEAAGILLGAASMIGAGVALITVATGVQKFAKISANFDLPKLGAGISMMIGTLAVPFQKIGAGEYMEVLGVDGKKQWIKFGGGSGGLFGLGGSNPVAMGISSVLRMGTALTNIAGGVQNMANLKFPTGFDKDGKATGYETIGGDAFKKVITNTMMMVGSLAVPFAKIGMGGKQTIMTPDGQLTEVDFGAPSAGGLLGFLSGGGAVQKGIHSVMSMGKALSNIAGGVQDMSLLKFPTGFDKEGKATGFKVFDADAAQRVTSNTQMLVGALSSTFAQIGASPDANDGSWWGGKSTIEKGIEIVNGIGLPLSNLATGVQNMANLKFPTGFDKDGKATGYETISDVAGLKAKIGKNTEMLITALTDVFVTIGGGKSKKSSWWQGASKFEKGIQVVTMIAEPYKLLGDSVKGIIDVLAKFDSKVFSGKIEALINNFTMAGNYYGEGMFAGIVFKQASEGYQALADGSKDIIKLLEKFKGSNFKSSMGFLLSALLDFAPRMADGLQSLSVATTVSKGYVILGKSLPPIIQVVSGLDSALFKLQITDIVSAMTETAGQDPVVLLAKETLLRQLGATYIQMSQAIPEIVTAIAGFDMARGGLFFGGLINPVDEGDRTAGYNAQTGLWGSIGTSMMQTKDSMPQIAGAINSMDLAKLTEARTMFEALATLSNGADPGDILAQMGESLETALQNLADMLTEFKGAVEEGVNSQTSATGGLSEILSKFNPLNMVKGGGSSSSNASSSGSPDNSDVVAAISKLQTTLISKGIKLKGNSLLGG